MRNLFYPAVLIVAASLSAPRVMADDVNCRQFRADITVQTNGVDPWLGRATLWIDNDSFEGAVVAIPRSAPPAEGVWESDEDAYFSSKTLNFHVLDHFILRPTGAPGTAMFHADGTIDGKYVSGRLRIHGPVYFNAEGGATGELRANGTLCTLGE